MAFVFDTTGRLRKGFSDAALFRPRSVLFLGDPALPEARVLARNLREGGFQGRLLAEGWDGFERPEAGSEPVDLGVIALPPDRIGEGLARLRALGGFAAVVPVHAPNLLARAREHGARALGERSFGLALPAIGLNATLAQRRVPPGALALVAQSSAVARAALDWAAAEGLGFSAVVGIGANDDIGFALNLDRLARDSKTACVMLEIRRVKDPRLFVSAARAAARQRPVIALRPGEREAGAVAVTDAVLRRAGALHVRGLEEWFAAAETLARTRAKPGSGERVAVVANGLGPARLAADALLELGLRLAEFSAPTAAALQAMLPEGFSARNPLSLGAGAGTRLAEAAAALAAAPEVDAVIALHAPAPEADDDAALAALRAAGQANRGAPVLAGWLGRLPEPEAKLPIFATPEGAARGALHLARERRNRAAAAELPPAEVLDLAPDRECVRRLFAAARAEGREALREDEALAVLSAYGLPVAPFRAAATPADCAAAAAILGFPCVVKALGTGLRFKTDKGAVALHLASGAEALAAARAMEARLAPPLFLVQRQAESRGAMELRIRAADDPMFGPFLAFGQGGTAAELAEDEALDLPPLNLPLAHALIARTRLARLLPGWRDRPPVAEPAVADALVRASQLLVDFPEIAELVVNPLFADAQGVMAVDALLRLRPPGERAEFAILPYPQRLAHEYRARDGRAWEVRPIRPEDAAAQARFFRRLPPEDVRYRFFSVMRELPPALNARLTQIDYGREMAFVARRGGETEGVVRVIRELGAGKSGEFAVVVAPEAKGSGLAAHLMRCILDWARGEGMAEITGHVLADNAPMLGFVRKLGFEVRRSAEDAEVMEARMELTGKAEAA